MKFNHPFFVRGATLAAGLLSAGLLFAQTTHEVVIQNYSFSPAVLTIRAGDTVSWVNHEKRTSHSVLFPDENLPESERLFPDERWQRTFARPGAYPYRCGPHPEMKGQILVE